MKLRRFILLWALSLSLILGGCGTKQPQTENTKNTGQLKVHYIDVGQADAILIQQGDSSMLIDAGNNADSEKVLGYLKRQGVEELEYVIGTHPHEDHIGALDEVIDELQVKKLLMPKVTHTTRTFNNVVSSAKRKNLKLTSPKIGEEFKLGEATVIILAPNSAKYEDLNDYSIVARIIFGDTAFMFTGDAESHSEEEILENGLEVKSDVLKAGHHGSRSSSSAAFLKKVDPEYVVISCGVDNDYGHPHEEIISRYSRFGFKVFRTDEMGDIVCTSDGTDVEFNKKADDKSNEQNEKTENLEEAKVRIEKVDKVGELVYIKNYGENDVNLKGYKIVSLRGNQEFVFPDFIIKAGEIKVISSGEEKGDIHWGRKNIWSNSQEDKAELRNPDGEIVK